MDAATEPRDASMTVRDGRTVAWTDWGDADGIALLRVPGTPGCRWSVRSDRTPWAERGLRAAPHELALCQYHPTGWWPPPWWPARRPSRPTRSRR